MKITSQRQGTKNPKPANITAQKRQQKSSAQKGGRGSKINNALVDQIADLSAKTAGAKDVQSQDRVTLSKLKDAEALADFQDLKDARALEKSAQLIKAECLGADSLARAYQRREAMLSDIDSVDVIEFSRLESERHIELCSLKDAVVDMDKKLFLSETEVMCQAGSRAAKLATVAADRILAESRLLDIEVSKLEPTNALAEELWIENHVCVFSTVTRRQIPSLSIFPSALSNLLGMNNWFDSDYLEDVISASDRRSVSGWLDYLADQGRYVPSESLGIYDSLNSQVMSGSEETHTSSYTVDNGSPVSKFDLLERLEPVKLCDLDPACYNPLAAPFDLAAVTIRDEISNRLGTPFSMAVTTALWGPMLALSAERIGLSLASAATNSWYNMVDKFTKLASLELMAVPVRQATILGDNRPHLDRTSRSATSVYFEQKTFVKMTFSDGTIRISLDPREFGLEDWAERSRGVDSSTPELLKPFVPSMAYLDCDMQFKTLMVNTSLLHELIQRKTLAVSSCSMKMERAYKLAEASDSHQELMKTLLRTGKSTYRDTLQFSQTILLNSPGIRQDF